MKDKKKPEIKNQCKATFTLTLRVANHPYIVFNCMRKKHDDGKHEHTAISDSGWEYRFQWDEPVYAQQKAAEELFTGKVSKGVQ